MKTSDVEASRQQALDNVRARMDVLLAIYALLEELETAIEEDNAEAAALIIVDLTFLKKRAMP